MIKYAFITHIHLNEKSDEDYEIEYYCNYYTRVDDLIEEFFMTTLADEPASIACSDFASTYAQFTAIARYNPQRKYKMSVVLFNEEHKDALKGLLELVDQNHSPTIKMIRQSGDTFSL